MKTVTAILLSLACTTAHARDICFKAITMEKTTSGSIVRDVYIRFKAPKLRPKTAANITGYTRSIRRDNNRTGDGFAIGTALMLESGKINYELYAYTRWGDGHNANSIHISAQSADPKDYSGGVIDNGLISVQSVTCNNF